MNPTNENAPENWLARIEPSEFATLIGLDEIAPGRVSSLLVRQLRDELLNRELNPNRVIQEISALESGDPSALKAPVQNKFPPLKGLWHQHYAEPGVPSIAMNLLKGLNRHGMPYVSEQVKASQASGEIRYVTPEDVPAIVDDIISGNLRRLAQESKLTGEWLIFAKHQGENFYLSLATHDKETHESVRQNIDQVCCREFDFLADLLATA